MEILVLSSVAIYYEGGEYYFGTSVHSSFESAHDEMIKQLIRDVNEKIGDDEEPIEDEFGLEKWFRYMNDCDCVLNENVAKVFIDSTDFAYRIEKYTMKWEASA